MCMKLLVGLLLVMLLFSGCQKEDVRTYTAPRLPIETGYTSSAFTLHSLPNHWIVLKEQGMRLATILHADKPTKAFDMSISQFPGPLAGLTDNVNRWRQQLKLPDQTEKQIRKNVQNRLTNRQQPFRIVRLKGTDQCMRVAIFERQKATAFIKLTHDCDAADEHTFDEWLSEVEIHD